MKIREIKFGVILVFICLIISLSRLGPQSHAHGHHLISDVGMQIQEASSFYIRNFFSELKPTEKLNLHSKKFILIK